MVAALAAVSLYLEQEEAEAAAARQREVSRRGQENTACGPWGQSGRQEMMAMRRLIQLRTFTRF